MFTPISEIVQRGGGHRAALRSVAGIATVVRPSRTTGIALGAQPKLQVGIDAAGRLAEYGNG